MDGLVRGIAAAVLGLAVLAGIMWAAYAYLEPRRRANQLQEAVRAQRLDADACRRGLVTAEANFREYDARVASLRSRVDRYESLHPEGVPADSFEVYLEVFDRYNEAVEGWQDRAEALRREREECVEVVEVHNELSDSLRVVLVEIGEIEPDAMERAPGAAEGDVTAEPERGDEP